VLRRATAAEAFGPSALMTPANGVTLARVAAMPILMVMMANRGATWATVGFWFCISCTDGLDGWLARRHGATRSGAFLDPLADKVVVLAAMAVLVAQGVFWWFPVALIAVREAGLVIYRSSLARRGVSIPARPSAKLKTLVQDLAVGAALLPWTADQLWIARTVLWVAVVLTLFTGWQYLSDGRRAGTLREVTGAV
jgi:CDP-diacylglycerol--glycerol-3-phosphate 3-phosphatidyltransferase